MTRRPAVSRQELREHLVATRIAGDVATTRQNNLANIRRMLAREPHYTFGLTLDREWTFGDVVALLAERVGIDPDAARDAGADRIDPELCLDALDRMADRIADVAAARGRVLLATGHPTGLLVVHQAVARALAAAGCEVLTTADGGPVSVDGRTGRVLYVDGVAVLATGAHLLHTHEPEPMRTVLAGGGDRPPDLVVADHGWAGAAGQAGVATVGFADCNDPALFVGEAEGKVAVTVPLDDNVLPRHYAPMSAYLLAGVAG
jgi:hypothetical protein